MSLLWAAPVLAAAVATVLVVARGRAIEDESAALAREVGRLREVRDPLAAVRTAAAETGEVVAAFRDRHALDADGG